MTFEKVRDRIVETLSCDAGKVTMEARLAEDLEADSLAAVELSMALEEAFGTGTAAVISPIGEFLYRDDAVTINDFRTGELTQKLYDYLTGIQWGRVEDTYGWTTMVD